MAVLPWQSFLALRLCVQETPRQSKKQLVQPLTRHHLPLGSKLCWKGHITWCRGVASFDNDGQCVQFRNYPSKLYNLFARSDRWT